MSKMCLSECTRQGINQWCRRHYKAPLYKELLAEKIIVSSAETATAADAAKGFLCNQFYYSPLISDDGHQLWLSLSQNLTG